MFGIIILYLKYEEKPAVTLIQILGPKANRGFRGDRVSDFSKVLGLFLN